MDELSLNRIADALERIATSMENAERRSINNFRKTKVDEHRAQRAKIIEESKKAIKEKIVASKGNK